MVTMAERVGVYPGTFDPITNGHLDIIARAARLFDRLVVGVAGSDAKGPILTLDERLELVRAEAGRLVAGGTIEARPMTGLLVAFARACGASAVVRGLRGTADFDYENQMAGMNHRLAPEIETVFLMAGEGHQFISSTLVRQVARMGGDFAGFVPAETHRRVLARLRG
jgi:pantetheine-phosphate adenylyltransferase